LEKIRFGRTELQVSRIAFGGIPIQRVSMGEAVSIIRGAYDLGVNFFDTAHAYGDSEEKIGYAIRDLPRDEIVIASKTMGRTKAEFLRHIDESLERLGTDYIDIYQIHHLSSQEIYDESFAEGGAYEGLMEAVSAGKVRFPGFSSHHIPTAVRVMKEGKFASVQLPFNFVDDTAAEEAVPLAQELDMGFIAMKPFGGGLLEDARPTFKYLMQFDNVVPDPGIEKLDELKEILGIVESGEAFTEEDRATIERLKTELGDSWCHRCEYCQPCPQEIAISFAMNIETVTKRNSYATSIELGGPVMEAARTCIECGACAGRCPYNLDIPNLLKERVEYWDGFVADAGL
jgi:predicted aldo/keto reductase-like oxidoreductase